MIINLDKKTKDIISNSAHLLETGSVSDFLNSVWDSCTYLYQFVDTVNYFTNDGDINLFDDVDESSPLYNVKYQWSVDKDRIYNPRIRNISCKLNGPMTSIAFPNLDEVLCPCINQCPELKDIDFGVSHFNKFPFTINFIKEYMDGRTDDSNKSLIVRIAPAMKQSFVDKARETKNPIYTNFINNIGIIYNK